MTACQLSGPEGIRLIFRGRCLRPEQRLVDCGVGEGSVLHMVSRPPPPAPSEPANAEEDGGNAASSNTSTATFRPFPNAPAGLMMGSVQVEADPSDPNVLTLSHHQPLRSSR